MSTGKNDKTDGSPKEEGKLLRDLVSRPLRGLCGTILESKESDHGP